MNGEPAPTCPVASVVAVLRGWGLDSGVEGGIFLRRLRSANGGALKGADQKKDPARHSMLTMTRQNLENSSVSALVCGESERPTFWKGVSPKVVHKLLPRGERNLVLCRCRKNPPVEGCEDGLIRLAIDNSLENVPHTRVHPRMALNED